MSFDLRKTDLAKLNSLTKYPSIPTYHQLDPKNGALLEETISFTGNILGTEKIDGTNARVICLPDGSFVIGSREELLYARGDLIGNPAQGIVDALKSTAETLRSHLQNPFQVFFLEVFGGKVTAASKQYTGAQKVSFRLFDAFLLPDYEPLLAKESHEIALWRENAGQPFADEEALQTISDQSGIALTPRLFSIDARQLPRPVGSTLTFLREALPTSLSILDEAAGGQSEGIVLRTPTRSLIAKARFADYERTLKVRAKQK